MEQIMTQVAISIFPSAGSRGIEIHKCWIIRCTFSEITNVPSSGCENLVITMNFSDQKVARNANVHYVSMTATGTTLSNDNIIFLELGEWCKTYGVWFF